MRKQFAFPIGWIYGDCWHRAVSDPVGRKGGPEGYQAGGRYGLGLDPLAGPGLQVIHLSDQEYGTQGDGENRRDQVAHGIATRQYSNWEIGSASCRESVRKLVEIMGDAVSLQKHTK